MLSPDAAARVRPPSSCRATLHDARRGYRRKPPRKSTVRQSHALRKRGPHFSISTIRRDRDPDGKMSAPSTSKLLEDAEAHGFAKPSLRKNQTLTERKDEMPCASPRNVLPVPSSPASSEVMVDRKTGRSDVHAALRTWTGKHHRRLHLSSHSAQRSQLAI